MAQTDVAALTQKLHALLKGATPQERQAVISATMILFGEGLAHTAVASVAAASPSVGAAGQAASLGHGIRAFFDAKQPKSKVEQLAVAARHREEAGATEHSRENVKAAFAAAKRPFDEKNFNRDLDNAKKSKLFNTGPGNLLSYFGEQFVDALPDRQATAALRRPGKAAKKTSAAKRAKR